MTLEINKSQRWLIAKAIELFTDEANLVKFLNEFEVDQDAMGADLEDLIEKSFRFLTGI